jgi:hypothetical protein
MASILFEHVRKERMIVLGLSKDWYTITPWEHKGEIMPYFGIRKNSSDSGNVKFMYMYLGPLSLVIGKWIG